MPKRAAPLDKVPDEAIERAESAVRSAGALAAKKLVDVPLSRGAAAQLAEALARRGLEQTGKHVRVPLREQLQTVLARDVSVAVAALRQVLRGTTDAAEVKHLVEEAVKSGAAQLVLRDGKEHLSAARSATLAAADLDALIEGAETLAKLRRKLVKLPFGVRPTLLVEDVRRILPQLAASPASPALLAIVDALRRGTSHAEPFAYLPELARRAGVDDAAAFRESVARLAHEGRIELRPESGLGLLHAGDAEWCPRAPDGAVLSYARPTGIA